MAVLLSVERKTAKARIFLALVYCLLILGGLTMVWPFMVMVASSFTNAYDYYRHSPAPRALWDRGDRFMRSVATRFATFPSDVYPEAPAHWGGWQMVSRDETAASFGEEELRRAEADLAHWQRRADDYAEFNRTYDLSNSVCFFDPRDVAGFVRRTFEEKVRAEDPAAFEKMSPGERRAAALARMNAEWPVRYESFFSVRFLAESRFPLHHASWNYDPADAKTLVWHRFKKWYRDQADTPMAATRPFLSRPLWNRYAGTNSAAFYDASSPVWSSFVRESYPRRLLRVRPTPELTAAYRAYVKEICRTPEAYSRLSGVPIASFDELALAPFADSPLWRNFIPRVPLENLDVLSAERSWSEFLLRKYGSLEGLNQAYGWQLARAIDAPLPLREALAISFLRHGTRDFLRSALANYRTVGEYLFMRGRAFGNTLLLVFFTILASLTVNPLAAYALSRFHLKCTEKVLMFLLATMAFPAAVTAIPGFLLVRDLGLLNTFAALILPTVASGMSIFILKGFFDGLPRELYEAAEIDGAGEMTIFLRVTLPMTTPILAVNALTAFVAAYNSWEWALLVCQDRDYWTLAVWMYQMSQQSGDQPWMVMAGFVLVSIPTAVVFLACQKIILRGIVLPSMK